MANNREDRWVADRIAGLEPEWRPDYAHGRTLLEKGLTERPRSWRWAAAVVAAGLCVALVFPQARALAEQAWYRLVLHRVAVVRFDLSKAPMHLRLTGDGMTESRVESPEEAERIAGFRPYLPPEGVLRTQPRIAVTGPFTIEAEVPARDLGLPEQWEGAALQTSVGAV